MKKKINVVGAVLTNNKKEILCALRGPQMSMSNYWEFPGGKIEANEQPEEALAREIKEELQCEIQVGEKIKAVDYDYEKVSVHLITYWATIANGTPMKSEHAELRWVPKAALEKLEWAPADIPTVKKLLGKI
ncbi:(deoxy)nucleoside triphosphate pyrophosphohydrolase [Aquibacillus albus]|uniref:8-oxo-dGTP diphosphatase n=1 Tax=Aquibacillus albus TaxID=1168171 RepID=A0ABS2N5F0_9BACI|nr:(deoxy)nucleoside triphosphate pyrophosphohydrolase [Aquibacillus albus]MBM7573344.1 8-oxo-dGTP diphosphatase [Aquibacillus albus]